jgi:hypothetical protein
MRLRIIIAIATVIALASCQGVVKNVELPKIEEMVVVQTGMSNLDSTFTAKITLSNPIFKTRKDIVSVEDAEVILKGSNAQDTLKYDVVSAIYASKANVNLTAGNRYDLVVNTMDGKELSSSSIMPVMPTGIEVEVDTIPHSDYDQYMYTISWDKPAENAYYEVRAYQIMEFDLSADTFLHWDSEYVYSGDVSASRLSERLSVYDYERFGAYKGVLIYVSGITQEFFDYSKMLYNYEPENPFSEPVSIPSNINGGLGMFVLKNSVLVTK